MRYCCRKISPALRTLAQWDAWKWCVLLVFFLGNPVLGQTPTPFSGTSPSAFQTTMNSISQGGIIVFDKAGIDFTNSDSAIQIKKSNITLRGKTSGGSVVDLSGVAAATKDLNNVAAIFNPVSLSTLFDISQSSAALSNRITNLRIGAVSLASGHMLPALTYFDGGDDTRTIAANNNKWLSELDGVIGLGVENMEFRNVTARYSDNTTNGLIGNVNQEAKPSSLGNIRGNIFKNITIQSNAASGKWFAGGGIVGVRSTQATAAIGDVSGNLFDLITIDLGANTYLEGGGLIGTSGVASPTDYKDSTSYFGNSSIESVDGNRFDRVEVSAARIWGGGIVGLNNNSRKSNDSGDPPSLVTLGSVHGNLFGSGEDGSLTITSAKDIWGAGVVGLNGFFEASAELENLSGNLFTGINVTAGTRIIGAGIVAVNSDNSEDVEGLGDPASPNQNSNHSLLREASGNIFDNIKVKTKNEYIQGGGVIAANASSTADAELSYLSGNVFNEVTVDAGSYLQGGGIVGVQTNQDGSNASLSFARGNLFNALEVKTNSGGIKGGGIIGLRANEGFATLAFLKDNIFKGLTVTTGGKDLEGGGIVGASSANVAMLSEASENHFDNLHVTGIDALQGGGIIGTKSDDLYAYLGYLENNVFTASEVSAQSIQGGGIIGTHSKAYVVSGDDSIAGIPIAGIVTVHSNLFKDLNIRTETLEGGGIIGSRAESGYAVIGSVTNNTFTGLDIEIGSSLEGGGVIGTRAVDGPGGINNVANNLLQDIKIHVDGYILGGGVIGVRANETPFINTVANMNFTGIQVTAGQYIDGGGVIGVTAGLGIETSAHFGDIRNSIFHGNTIIAENGQIMGGVIYSYGTSGAGVTDNGGSSKGMVITDSSFLDNRMISHISDSDIYEGQSLSARVYGTVAIDTAAGAGTTHQLTLRATSGHSTVFRNNTIVDAEGEHTNSLYFGTILGMDPPGSGSQGVSDEDEESLFMALKQAIPPTIAVTEDPSQSDAELVIDARSGGRVELYDPIRADQTGSPDDNTFKMTVQGNGGDFLWGGKNRFEVETPDDLNNPDNNGNTVRLLEGSRTTLLGGLKAGDAPTTFALDAENHDFRLESGGTLNVTGSNFMRLNRVNLNGHLHFNLFGTEADNPGTVLLTLHVPDGDKASIDGSLVTLSDFAAGPLLQSGDRFYLIDTGEEGYLNGDPVNSTAEARQGVTIRYQFIIDKDVTDSGNPAVDAYYVQGRRLVARLVRVSSAPENDIFPNGPIGSLVFLNQTQDWLIEQGYPLAENITERQCGDIPACGVLQTPCGQTNWQPFFAVSGGTSRYDVAGHVDLSGTMIHTGMVKKYYGPDSSVLLGAAFQTGWSHLNARLDITDHRGREVRGDGNDDFYGGQCFIRQNWRNGLYADASFSLGRTDVSFETTLQDVNGNTARYDMNSLYTGFHGGLGYQYKVSSFSTLDVSARYLSMRHRGGNVVIAGNPFHFDTMDSRRLRLGGRFTRGCVHFSSYVGAAWEYEFSGHARAAAYAFDQGMPVIFDVEGSSLQGGTGIGELGIMFRPRRNRDIAVNLGLEGYLGKRGGVTGNAGFCWQF